MDLVRTNLVGTSFADLFSARDLAVGNGLVVGTVPFGPAVGTFDAAGRYVQQATIEVHGLNIVAEFTESGPVVERHYMRGTLNVEVRFSPYFRRVINERYEEIATGGELQIVPTGGDWVHISPVAGCGSSSSEQWILNIGDAQHTFSLRGNEFVCECGEPCNCVLYVNTSVLCRRVPSRITAHVRDATYMWTYGNSWARV